MRSKFENFKIKHPEKSLIRWAVVGTITTAIDYLIFIALYMPTKSVFGANLVAAITATAFNYLMHHRWTFRSNQQHTISGVKYLVNLGFWWLTSSLIIKSLISVGIDARVAKLMPLIFIVPVNYFVLNRIVFSKKF
jgi:putative flippase GtrA